MVPEPPGKIGVHHGGLRKHHDCMFEPPKCGRFSEPLIQLHNGSISHPNDLFPNGFIRLAIDMPEPALSWNGPGQNQKPPGTNMTIQCAKKGGFILCRNMFSNLETENAIHGRLHERWIREISD